MSKNWVKKTLVAVGIVLLTIAACFILAGFVCLGAFIYENLNLGAFITFIVILFCSMLPQRLGSSRKW